MFIHIFFLRKKSKKKLYARDYASRSNGSGSKINSKNILTPDLGIWKEKKYVA